MESKKIIITGGAARIGASIAKSLAGHDIQITLHYNKSINKVKYLVKELESLGSEVFLIKADLSLMSQTKKIIPFAYKMMKGLDCLINNASVFEKDDLIDFNEKSFNKHMAVNLQAPAKLTQDFKKYLLNLFCVSVFCFCVFCFCVFCVFCFIKTSYCAEASSLKSLCLRKRFNLVFFL